MKTMTLQQQILAKIKSKNVRPKTRGYFVMRDTLIWSFVLIFIAILGLSFGMIIYTITSTDINVLDRLGFTTFEKINSSIPYFWILATVIVALGSYIGFRKTRRGYRLDISKISIVIALLAIGSGILVYTLQITQYIDTVASENIPIYNTLAPMNGSIWFNPDEGLLSGTIRARESESVFTIRDKDFIIWTIDSTDIDIYTDPRFQSGERIKIIGERTGPDTFKAIEVLPWKD